MADIVIRQVSENIWTFSRPFARLGFIPVGGRSTAIKLSNNDVWVIASTPLSPETSQKLNELGTVKYLIAPDAEHSIFLGEYHKAYPNAKVVGVEPLIAKRPEVQFTGAYGLDAPGTKYGFEDEITPCYFSGFVNKDVIFLHGASKTLITADLIFNLPATEQYSKTTKSGRIPLIGDLLSPWTKAHKHFLWGAGKDKEAMKRDARTVASWEFDKIIPCHGDVIEKDGKKAWLEAYQWYLTE